MGAQSAHIRQALSWLYLSHGIHASIALSSPIVETTAPEVPTGATDGETIYLNPDWLAQFKPKEIAFVIAHEVEHIIRLHALRRETRDARRWNEAGDYGINNDLMEMGLPMPTNAEGEYVGLLERSYAGLSTEQIYARLDDKPQDKEGSGDGSGDESGDSSGGGSGDESGDSSGDGSGGGKAQPEMAGDLLPTKAKSEAEKASIDTRVRGRIVAAAAQVKASKGVGAIPAHLQGLIDELTEPRVDWKQELHEFVTATAKDDVTWGRSNRRVRHRGLRLPAPYSETVGPIAVILDTSGSCWGHIGDFLSELQGAAVDAQPESIHIYFVDTTVQAAVTTTADDFEADMGDLLRNPPLGGGTDLRAGFSAIEASGEAIEAVLVLTDLYTPWPDAFEFADRTLFVDPDDRLSAPFGRKVVIHE